MTIDDAQIYYEESGAGPETVVFAHGLLWSGRMFDDQTRALRDRYRCITFDFRGQGRSEVTAAGYDIDRLSRDAARLIEKLDAAPCHFVGLSMGGFVGMRLAIRRPELLRSLTLMETSADPEPRENLIEYRLLGWVARGLGLRLVADRVMAIMFGRDFLNDPQRAGLRKKWRERLLANDRVGVFRALQGVIQRDGVYELLPKITLPTLVIVGDQDVATGPATAERIHQAIAGSQRVVIPGAGHTSTVEAPEAVNAVLLKFLTGNHVETPA
jgi:pimeloyl-ACP methyl ester carboxylesterase